MYFHNTKNNVTRNFLSNGPLVLCPNLLNNNFSFSLNCYVLLQTCFNDCSNPSSFSFFLVKNAHFFYRFLNVSSKKDQNAQNNNNNKRM